MKSVRFIEKVVFLGWIALLASCAGACGGDHAGTYSGTTVNDSLTLSSSCEYSYTGNDGCRSTGTYNAPLGSSGSVAVSIASTTGGNCLPAGDTTCSYVLSLPNLSFNCGAGTFSYTK